MKRLAFLIFIVVITPVFAEDESGLSRARFKAGMDYLKRGNNEAFTNYNLLEKAAEAFAEALEIDPDFAEAHYYLGVTCLAMDKPEEAVGQYHVLKTIDAELAERLSADIKAYEEPASYTKTGEKEVLRLPKARSSVQRPSTQPTSRPSGQPRQSRSCDRRGPGCHPGL